jgi:cobalamin biosynthetic protein CobC
MDGMDSGAAESGVADAPGYHGGPWIHGGNVDAARCLFPGAPEPWIDLSTGINPIPYPVGEIPPESWTCLPRPAELADLEATARRAYGAGPAAGVVAAPGTQAIIQWLPRIFPARRVGILGHTYGEHAKCWRAAGAEVFTADSLADFETCDAGIVVNPNNPDGRILEPTRLVFAAASLSKRGGLLVVDEAFMDVMPTAASLVPVLPPGTVVLRSFGKAYGLAGLRLGFAVTSGEWGTKLRTALGPWAVSGPAIALGRQALADRDWLAAATVRLNQEARRLDQLLRRAGFAVVGGTPLFRLAENDAAGMWFRKLGYAGILARPFPTRPNSLRLGIPPDDNGWARLETALGPIPALF